MRLTLLSYTFLLISSLTLTFSAANVDDEFEKVEFRFEVDECREELRRGRALLREVVLRLYDEEQSRQSGAWNALYAESLNHEGNVPLSFVETFDLASVNVSQICPKPNATLFPTPTPTTASTSTAASHNADNDEEEFNVPSVFLGYTSSVDDLTDPYTTILRFFYTYLSDEEAVCNGPEFTSLNSITEQQLYGFVSSLAVGHASPVCPVCGIIVGALERAIADFLSKHPLMADERFILKAALSILPSPATICTALFPSCAGYNFTNSSLTGPSKCIACSACMTTTIITEHKLLLVPDAMKKFSKFLDSSLFYNLCAELCIAYPPGANNSSLFPHGVPFDKCSALLHNAYNTIMPFLKDFLMPNTFCSVLLNVCELNATPNILHCLKELCDEKLDHSVFLRPICKIIPDEPQKADAFLNIRQPPPKTEL